jgi:hypothetical protein
METPESAVVRFYVLLFLSILGLESACGTVAERSSRPANDLEVFIHTEAGAEAARTRQLIGPHGLSWRPELVLPFAQVAKVELSTDPEAVPPRPPEVRVEFLMQGREDPARRVAVFCAAKDSGGHALFETWQLCEDQRIFARGENERTDRGRFGFSPMNLVHFTIPLEVQGIAALALRFDEMTPAEWYHFPLAPSPHGLTMTHPDAWGAFELIFGYPEGPAWQRDELHCVVVLHDRDPHGVELERTVRSLERPGPDGRFRARFSLPPGRVDQALAELVFFTRQDDNERFVAAHFQGLGDAAFGGGRWSSQTYELVHVPFGP